MSNKKMVSSTAKIWLLLATLFLTLSILKAFNLFSFMGKFESFFISFAIQVLIMFVLSIFLFSKSKKQSVKTTLSDFKFKKIYLKAIVLSVFIGAIVFVLNIFVASFFDMILSLLGYEPFRGAVNGNAESISVWTFLLSVLTGCVFPAVCEETSHRGLLISGFSSLGMKKIIIISGVLFGMMHFDISKMGYAMVIGFLLAYITIISQSIFPAMIIHFMNNFLGNLFNFSLSNDGFIGKAFQRFLMFFTNSSAIGFLGIILIVLGLLVFLWILTTLLFKETALRNLALQTKEFAHTLIRKNFLNHVGIQDLKSVKNFNHTNKNDIFLDAKENLMMEYDKSAEETPSLKHDKSAEETPSLKHDKFAEETTSQEHKIYEQNEVALEHAAESLNTVPLEDTTNNQNNANISVSFNQIDELLKSNTYNQNDEKLKSEVYNQNDELLKSEGYAQDDVEGKNSLFTETKMFNDNSNSIEINVPVSFLGNITKTKMTSTEKIYLATCFVLGGLINVCSFIFNVI